MSATDATWSVAMNGRATFSWDYDAGNERLLSLYRKGKDKQWDQERRIDWDVPTDPDDPLGMPDVMVPLYGSPTWAKLGPKNIAELRLHGAAWQFSQFLHGEQGALICASRLVESVPGIDAKLYAATQVVDEARHTEIFSRFLTERVGVQYPINQNLASLLDDTLTDSRWDLPYLGMQVLIEGLALAAFGLLRDMTTQPLARQILAYVMQDEARHVAFGRLALRDYYREIDARERAEREDFVIEACYRMRDRFLWTDVIVALGYERSKSPETRPNREALRMFQRALFGRIVPCVRDIGLWTDRVRAAYADIGVLDLADVDLQAAMARDEDLAEQEDRARDARVAEVGEMIARGADG
ncbi:ferritin-like domain-containing protein [Actinomadura rayongensis]|nr:ferritin-like domain-containing protein [Actinomadura rayongensis]